jgi:oligopeptide transport system substrate-binding protein
MNLGAEPLTLDWNLANDSNSFDIISNIMIGLTRFSTDKTGSIVSVPGCADRWEISADGLEYVFFLNKKVLWSDGKPVRAQDFDDSFRRALDPLTAAPYAELLSIIDLDKTTALDDFTLKITLKNPAGYFIYLTSYGLALPIRKDVIEKYGKNWTEPENLISNGPFKLKEWQHEYKIVLERNANFAFNQADQKNLVRYLKYFMVQEQSSAFTLFLNKQFDWIDGRSIPISELKKLNEHKKNSQYQVKSFALLRNTYVGFNTTKKPFDQALIRKAFSLSINRDLITKVRSKGDQANNTWVPPNLGQYLDYDYLKTQFKTNYGEDFTANGYHPELARKLLAQAGFPNGKNFPEVEFLIPNRDDTKLLAETLQAIWKKELNIEVKITAMEWKSFLTQLKDNPPELFRLNWGADYPDPDTFAQLFVSNNQINYGHWSNPLYDSLIKTAGASNDLALRKKLYSQAEFLLTQKEVAIAPLYIDKQVIFARNHVQNLEFNPMDIVFLDRVNLLK